MSDTGWIGLGLWISREIVARLGGEDNAFTSWDYTAYFQRIGKEHLGTLMQFEADRMINLVLTDEVMPVLTGTALARELTKLHEEVFRGTAAGAEARLMAQPVPVKWTSRTAPSSPRAWTSRWSPQSGLSPSAWWVAPSSGPKFRGRLP